MLDDHFITKELPNKASYSWTLTARLGQLLQNAEACYGGRDYSWTILGIEFVNCGAPYIWYPIYSEKSKAIIIRLTMEAVDNLCIACYQLSHECIHLLSPDRDSALVIEEGLATVYSEDHVKAYFGRENMTTIPSYCEAAKLVRQLLSIRPDAITKLRAVEPSLKKLTADTFSEAGLDIKDQDLIAELMKPFVRK